MSAQIAFTLPQKEKKVALQKRLARDGLTTKAFFTFCVDAYLNHQINIGIVSDPDRTHESEEDYQAYLDSLDSKHKSYTLSEVRNMILGE